MARKLAAVLGGTLYDKTIALLGLTFKPNTDDMREAPSLALIAGLHDMGAHIRACDPVIKAHEALPHEVTCCASPYEAAQGADALVLVTEWAEFAELEWPRLKRVMRAPVLLDLRRFYTPASLSRSGFRYYAIGIPRRSAAREPAVQTFMPRTTRANGGERPGLGATAKSKRQRRPASESLAPV
jgi:UDPglucose 6-dehydrogenase